MESLQILCIIPIPPPSLDLVWDWVRSVGLFPCHKRKHLPGSCLCTLSRFNFSRRMNFNFSNTGGPVAGVRLLIAAIAVL